ncbi:ATP-grasp fold amidoligase family protein [Lentibacillus amyloliquefaciens]|uniref:Teichuronopeptide biosynthesis n=1 Tax=Lentibacillus amyloliquefaciens TaxID=1472767 RepID=A0A0U4FW12_9BACI|nr:ATP-grasp fold amidoligase family protein [Lentibacillus amyloliquefaciens]ALX49941.1 teichuronopeptide biosynthesis [Lentibacillus amyloliquefaciens]
MVTITSNNHLNDAYQSEKELELELTKKLMEKEAKIDQADKAIKNDKKELKHIEDSKTWKYAKPLQKQTGSRKKQNAYIMHMEEKLKETRQALYDMEEENNRLRLDSRKPDSNQMLNAINEAKNDGKLLNYLGKVIRQKHKHEANYNQVLRYAARLYMNEQEDFRNLVYSSVLAGLKMEDIPEFIIRSGVTDDISLRPAVSFRASLNRRMRQMQLMGSLPEWVLDNKLSGYSFADAMGIRRPWTPEEIYSMKNLPAQERIVIKPADGAGSRGVYLVNDFNDIVDMKRSKKLENWDELNRSMTHDLESGWVTHDEWTIEELILESRKMPASDIKFYCFYGKVGLILEIVRYPELKYCWWTATGERIRTGKYDQSLFKGKGVSQHELNAASDISKKIPAPFIRIDYLRSENELVFGEFTPKPGNYDEFDKATDQWLGDYFVEAEGRLINDLLEGKQFDDYIELANR